METAAFLHGIKWGLLYSPFGRFHLEISPRMTYETFSRSGRPHHLVRSQHWYILVFICEFRHCRRQHHLVRSQHWYILVFTGASADLLIQPIVWNILLIDNLD
ncbi:hypothetical protein ABZP36_001746 [Zizania latifolia]